MIKRAPTKIILFICLFALGIACCIAIEKLIPSTDQRTAQAYGSSDQQASQQDDMQLSPASLVELLQDQDSSIDDLARSSFDISLGTDLPQAFEDECLKEDDFASAHTAGSLFSLTFDGDTSAARKHCEGLLQEKGWSAVEGNNELIESFSRSEGTYRWLVLQYFALDSKTVIVINPIEVDR